MIKIVTKVLLRLLSLQFYEFREFVIAVIIASFSDVICIDESRVVLNWPPGHPNDYIHANWVQVRGEKRYICTQGPTPKTVEDFWRMVFQEKIKGIVSLTEIMELGKKKFVTFYFVNGIHESISDVNSIGPKQLGNQ